MLCEKNGLAEETSKAFDENIIFKSWGALVEGGRGRAGAPPAVRHQLLRVTVALLAVGWANKQILHQIFGLFASVFILQAGTLLHLSLYLQFCFRVK